MVKSIFHEIAKNLLEKINKPIFKDIESVSYEKEYTRIRPEMNSVINWELDELTDVIDDLYKIKK